MRLAPALLACLVALPAAAEIEITDPVARSSSPMAAAAYMTITNTGETGDRLLGVRTVAAERAEFHSTEMVDDVMRMRPIEGGIDLPPGASVTFERGGDHVMLMGLAEGFGEDGAVPLTLSFETAGDLEVEALLQD
ncbi:copper chaperone PCu(A)C [Histidinibacterium aquaticum]|nr:copper chaperone PCu(A)C [Histidinibacterium aquaticum]